MTADDIKRLRDHASDVGGAAHAILARHVQDRQPTQDELSQAWEAALDQADTAYARMMARHGLYAPWSGVGDGWVPLVDQLITDLRALGWGGAFTQVKEKYGQLCIYWTGGRDDLDELVIAAELASLTICEICGAPGVLRSTGPDGTGWLFTACETHAVRHGVVCPPVPPATAQT